MRVLDLDSHEFIPTHLWKESFGPVGAELERAWFSRTQAVAVEERKDGDRLFRPDVVADVMPIDPESLWEIKGCSAPGAIDMRRRIEVLDTMEIDRQLLFPTFGFIGMGIAFQQTEYFRKVFTGLPSDYDHRRLGLDVMRAHNDWLIQVKEQGLDSRLHLVAVIPTFDFDDMMSEAKRVLEGDARALWVPAMLPPGGTSPANTAMDQFWSLAEEYDVPVVLHLGTEPFLPIEWEDCPAFVKDYESEQLPSLSPYFMTVFYFAVENYLASMVLGGVFDRHPRLRFGVIECGAAWVGPLVERMETFVDFFAEGRKLLRRPTQYLVDQVRVTPFCFDPVDLFVQRNPELLDVYCYSSDYPHVEGGQRSRDVFYDRLSSLGDEVVDKFFRTNAELVLPS